MGGIVLLGPVIAAFHAGDKNLEPFRETRIAGHRFGQGRDFHWMAIDQCRLDQCRFDSEFKGLYQRLANARLAIHPPSRAAKQSWVSSTVFNSRKSTPVFSFTASAIDPPPGLAEIDHVALTLNSVLAKTVSATCLNMSSIRFMLYS